MMILKRHSLIIFSLALFGLVLLLLIKSRQSPEEQPLAISPNATPRIEQAPLTVKKTNQPPPPALGLPPRGESLNEGLAVTLLREIALDEQGRPVIDSQLKRQLDNAVNLIGRERSPAELDKLSQLIKQTFDPATAKTVDNVLHRYYSYKIAEQNYATTLSANDAVDTLKNAQTFSAMRESYLGHELAEQLFSEDRKYNDYISELTGQLSAPDLSEEMRSKITTELQKKYHQEQEESEGL